MAAREPEEGTTEKGRRLEVVGGDVQEISMWNLYWCLSLGCCHELHPVFGRSFPRSRCQQGAKTTKHARRLSCTRRITLLETRSDLSS